MEKGTQYRTLLIQAIHACATKFADVAERCAHAKRGHCYVFVFSFHVRSRAVFPVTNTTLAAAAVVGILAHDVLMGVGAIEGSLPWFWIGAQRPYYKASITSI